MVGNGGAPWRGPVSVYAGKDGTGSAALRIDGRVVQVPPSAQSFSYDADGNLLRDGV